MTQPALTLNNVTIRYETGGVPVLQEISFSIAPNERVALVGLNGSGKTTLLMSIVGLVAHEGEITVAGTPVSSRTLTEVREQIGFLFNVPEDQLLFPKVIEDVAFGLLRRGVPREEAFEKARSVLASLGLERIAELPLHHLSHGQKQKVALAGILSITPPLLLLDEPSAGLDPPGKRTLSRLLSSFSSTMLIATHDLNFSAQLCTRYIVLSAGKISFDGASLEETTRHLESADE